jgi:hypothetical protein
MKPLFFATILLCYSAHLATGQVGKAATYSPSVVRNALQAVPSITFSSAGPVSSVQMTGIANWICGSEQKTSMVLLQASAAGQSRMEFQVAAGTRVETQNAFTDGQRRCTWTGFDRAAHASAPHHCWINTAWFLPQLTMQSGAGAPHDSVSATAAPDGGTIRIHHERHPVDVQDNDTGKLLAHLTGVDLDIDAVSGLPLELAFAAHPDNDAGTEIPVQVQYSDYRSVNNVTVPFHIQKFIKHSLVLDLQVSAVQVQLASSAASLAQRQAQ